MDEKRVEKMGILERGALAFYIGMQAGILYPLNRTIGRGIEWFFNVTLDKIDKDYRPMRVVEKERKELCNSIRNGLRAVRENNSRIYYDDILLYGP
ncbi:MAG: hypothetical protein ABIH72_02815 [archaeon]